nr:clockwork orange protein [Pachycrepoideus vindemmiae]
MVTHSMENILNMQYYAPVSDEALHLPPSRKKRCLAKEVNSLYLRQDPMSHRIIEKRRRDRMNNCLADLSRLIPAEYLKKGRGRVEKTEIIEMAIRHMKHLQGLRQDSKHHTPVSSVHAMHTEDSVDSVSHPSAGGSSAAEHYRLGYQECLSETMHFLVEVEGYFARDALCVQLISHLQQHCDKILATSDRLGFPHPVDLPSSNGTACNGHQSRGGLIPPPNLASDDSNHSSHSHGSSSLLLSHHHHDHHHHHHHHHESQRPPANYKFKNSIKQRFSADQRIKSSGSPPPSSSSAETSPKHHHQLQSGPGVPIFALHDNGGFYVPLTLEASLLRPHLGYAPADVGPDVVLHPVTISVNFNHTPPGGD